MLSDLQELQYIDEATTFFYTYGVLSYYLYSLKCQK